MKIIFNGTGQLFEDVADGTFNALPAWDERAFQRIFQIVLTRTDDYFGQYFNAVFFFVAIDLEPVKQGISTILFNQVECRTIIGRLQRTEGFRVKTVP